MHLGSVRECQAILILEGMEDSKEWNLLDRLGRLSIPTNRQSTVIEN